MLKNETVGLATPAVKLEKRALDEFLKSKKAGSTTGTTVVFDQDFDALYFSKAVIPLDRSSEPILYRHIGLYGYRLPILQKLACLPQSRLEKMERLEQLRALEHKIPIRVVIVDYRNRTHGSVDLPEDVKVVESIIEKEGELV